MSTVTVNCPRGVYTQVTTLDDAYCIVSSPLGARNDGQKLRVHIGSVAPADDTLAYHPLEQDEAFERPAGLVGHIFILTESYTAEIPVTEAV